MTLILIIAAAIPVIWLAERSVEHLVLAIAALCFGAAALLLVVGDPERAILLTLMLAMAIIAASRVKYGHSGLKLLVTDVPLLFAGTTPFFLVQYPLAVASVLAGGMVLVLAAVATVLYAGGSPLSLEARLLILATASSGLFAATKTGDGAAASLRLVTRRRGFLSTFVASLLDPRSWRPFGGLKMSDMASESLPLLAAVPAHTLAFPDIIIIQHESIFDPRAYGLPVDPTVEAFLSPPGGRHGSLNVDIFGGGSWQSEFSVLTGLSSASFGSSAYHLFTRGVGRFRHNLPQTLSALGYATMLASSCRRNFLNYDAFYGAIGMGTRLFTDDLPPPFDLGQFEATHSDAQFLPAAIAAHADRIDGDAAPRFLYTLTNFNHGPHHRRLAAPGQFERERAFAAASLPDPLYAEYYARLAETAATWARLRAELTARFPDRPMLIIHYGDHQPVMTRRIEAKLKLPPDARRQFRTFYAVEALNGAVCEPGRGPDLDIAFLGTLALQQAGLPLDAISVTRASLLQECGDGYFASASERKRRFHRTLVELGAIDLAPAARR
jgi:hypothetical protein